MDSLILELLAIFASSGLIIFIIKNSILWYTFKNKYNPTEEEEFRLSIARRSSMIGMAILVIFVIIGLFFFFKKDTVYPPPSPTPYYSAFPSNTVEPTNTVDSQPIQEVENIRYSNGLYSGSYDTVNKRPEGSGTMTFDSSESGLTYEGDWWQGKKHGQGKMTYKNGDIYDGFWENDMKSGDGTYTWKNGGTYVGPYLNDKRNGTGTYTNWTGIIYKNEVWTGEYYGDFVNGVFEGYGKFTITNGDIFEGIFRDGKVWQGTYTRNGIDIEIKEGV
jgi:hypothetical protein